MGPFLRFVWLDMVLGAVHTSITTQGVYLLRHAGALQSPGSRLAVT